MRIVDQTGLAAVDGRVRSEIRGTEAEYPEIRDADKRSDTVRIGSIQTGAGAWTDD